MKSIPRMHDQNFCINSILTTGCSDGRDKSFVSEAILYINPKLSGDCSLEHILGCYAYFSASKGNVSTTTESVGIYAVVIAFDTILLAFCLSSQYVLLMFCERCIHLTFCLFMPSERSTRGELLSVLILDSQ